MAKRRIIFLKMGRLPPDMNISVRTAPEGASGEDRMKLKKAFAMMLAAVTAAGILSGCGSSKIGDYATTEVAKYGSEPIYLEEANFWLRYEQITNEAYYGQMYKYFGYDNMWTMPDGNDGKRDPGHRHLYLNR